MERSGLLRTRYCLLSISKKLIESEKRLFAPQLVTYALEVCEAMAFVHSTDVRGQQGVVHRDLKPANIMLERRMGVKITDFGLAKVISTTMQTTKVVGTPQTMVVRTDGTIGFQQHGPLLPEAYDEVTALVQESFERR